MVAADDPTPGEQDQSIVPDPTDAIEFEPIKRTSPKRTGLLWLLAVLVIGGGAGAWYYKGDLLRGGGVDEIPVIRAVEGPVKVRPENPGGMLIPDRDKLVYDRMKGDGATPRLERLLPPPETPLAPPAPKPEPPISEPEPKPEPVKAEVKKAEAPKPEPEPVKAEMKKVEAPKPKPQPKPQPKKVDAPKPTPKPAPPLARQPTTLPDKVDAAKAVTPKPWSPEAVQANPPDISALAYKVQLAAVRSRELAASEWKRLRKKNNDLLGAYTMSVVRADLGPGKGVYFRLRAGPIAGEDVAKALCRNLAERRVACLIVRPGN